MGFYIIEINDKYKQVVLLSAEGELYCKDVAGLMPYTEPDLEQVRKEAYEQGYKKCLSEHDFDSPCVSCDEYKRGLADAWEAARKIASDNAGRNYSIFGQHFTVEILNTHSASECIEKIRQYEQEQEEQIQVGDEVITASGKAVVTGVGPVHFEYVYADGSHGYDEVKNVKKTGRHFPEIAEVLQKMKETE